MKHLFSAAILAASLLAFNAQAMEKYEFDKGHTNIMWFASHFGFSQSMGQFMEYDGEYVLDTDKPENSHVNVTIKTDSIMTGLQKFDDHLKSDDFFDIEKHPTATFKSTKVDITSDKAAQVHGDFTLLGITKPLTLDVTLNKIGVNPYNQKQTAGFTAKTTIKRSDYGMDYALPGVSDEVNILIETEGLRSEKQ